MKADMRAVLESLLEHYVSLALCGSWSGNWNPEIEDEVIAARAALASTTENKAMKFQIYRANDYTTGLPPCDKAFAGKVMRVDTRTVDDPAKLKKPFGDEWYRQGTNHRVEDGRIKRDMGLEHAWFIEISTLEELTALVASYGVLEIDNGKIMLGKREG